MNQLISVIIPVYNAENYIQQCIKSLLEQTYIYWEAILVNDGSSDNSLKICEKFSSFDNRIKIISIDNQGVSVARNVGLELAKGDWIAFLDADDWMEPCALEEALKMAQTGDFEIVCYNRIVNTTKGNRLGQAFEKDVIEFHGQHDDLNMNIIHSDWTVDEFKYFGEIRCVWGKLFKAKIAKQLRFPVGVKLAEDALFCYQAFKLSPNIIFINKYWIYYRMTDTSANRSYRINMKEDVHQTLNAFYKELSRDGMQDKHQIIYNHLACEFMHYYMAKYLCHIEHKESFFSKLIELKQLLNSDDYTIVNSLEKDFSRFAHLLLKLIVRRKAWILLIIYELRTIKRKIVGE